ncbi:DNA-binding transcriptional regulator [Vibrio cortegadensis]|uniref:XylR family transcriptional regulator n=1 Tax=Vibrio cortegadensis TaxID=1328770 RepID=UPI0021C2766B|nr:DNA-binding transcriptional regulator [Vibrio cortegadensis]MDN3697570.1 DNA-binding transcriptional regulator [Vibrio cortegadensis]
MSDNKAPKIALLFNANKVYDRDVMSGIGEYIHTTNVKWNIFVEDDFRVSREAVLNWNGDGIIADFDDVELSEILLKKNIPVVGIGSSYRDEANYPDVPYVATDNLSVIDNAYEHLRDKGVNEFAFYGLPETEGKRWARERELCFQDIMNTGGHDYWVYRGLGTSSLTWEYGMNRLTEWLKSLPRGTGIIAVTDSRARHLLQACDHAGIIVPDHLSIIGVDNERVARHLTRISLSSVDHNCKKIGYESAKMLHHVLEGKHIKKSRVVVPSVRIYERESSNYRSVSDPEVVKAVHYIRTHIRNGIKVYHVLDELRLSRSNLESRFKSELGCTIHHEIHETRLKLACSYLESTELKIGEIYSMCGYPSLQYMYSVFSKSLNMTPKEYKDKVTNEVV